MSAKNRWTMFGVLPALLVLAGAAEVEAAEFHFLGATFGARVFLRVNGISADGTTAVGVLDYDDFMTQFTRARLWGADGEHLWEGDFDGAPTGISGDGSVLVGGMGDVGPLTFPGSVRAIEAFRWTSGGGVVGLGYLTEGATYSSASAVSADGSTVVGQGESDSGCPAFRWTQSEGMVSLGMLPGHMGSRAESVSADGSVIVGVSGASADEAFRWTADGEMVGLGRLGDHLDSYAEDVSADGSVVVGYSGNRARYQPPPGRYPPPPFIPPPIIPPPFIPEPPDPEYEAFVWTEADGMVGLGHLPGHDWSKASAVSADGSIVVGASNPAHGPAEAFIWDAEHGMRNLRDLLISEYQLELPDWALGRPIDISADGTVIVGNGYDGSTGGLWMVVIPEPSTIVLALTGLLGLVAYTWRKRRHAA